MTRHDPSAYPDDAPIFRHLGSLAAGLLAGLVAVYYFAGINFDFSGELNRAKELGIVSRTILMRYPKGRDILNFLAMMGFPIVLGLGTWLAWVAAGGQRAALVRLFAPPAPLPGKDAAWRRALVFTGCLYLLLSFDLNHFHAPAYNSIVGAWPFLGEEGENLAWAQSILNGGVYGRDFHCLYGPMLVYPLAFFMELFGRSVVAARQYCYLLNLAAYGIILLFLYRFMRSKTAFIGAALGYILVFRPDRLLAPNETYLRVALGLVPILLVATWRGGPDRRRLLAAGLVLGQCCLFSQEVGVCSLLAVLALLAVRPRPAGWLGGFAREAGGLALASALSAAPLLLYFAWKGALGALLDNLLVHPRLLGLGFTAIAFPDFREFLHNPLSGQVIFHYWVIFVYLAAALYLIPLLLLGRRDQGTLLRSALLLFGALLYRAALARSDVYHVMFVSPPAFLLVFLFLEDLLHGVAGERSGALQGVRFALAGALVGGGVLLAINSSYVMPVQEAKMQLHTLPDRLSVRPAGVAVPGVPRGGIFFDPGTATSLETIGTFLDRHTRPGDGVFFFPNEAAYYFLFNRNNPTRFVISYFAVTREQRLELISDLERNRPEFVVFSRATWRVDKIPESVQVPEVCDYLSEKYSVQEDHGDVVMLRRNAP
jgi:hypothetical protein